MFGYALIKDGVVVNAVVWNGEGDLFSEYETYEIKEGDQVGPGFTAEKDKKGNWIFTAPVIVLTDAQKAEINLRTAQAEYDLASAQITSINQRIEDEDYSEDYTEASITSSKVAWTNYRKALRSYIVKGDGAAELPKI
ncbi:hypothetical protein [Pantoea agglomerans]|uniref:hypothetical protein n=1 Tax=Enterobacter agglomerans TaxID=549 RepID=UPI0016543075|nr:hypothetical protein [Pantoea agglomerans]